MLTLLIGLMIAGIVFVAGISFDSDALFIASGVLALMTCVALFLVPNFVYDDTAYQPEPLPEKRMELIALSDGKSTSMSVEAGRYRFRNLIVRTDDDFSFYWRDGASIRRRLIPARDTEIFEDSSDPYVIEQCWQGWNGSEFGGNDVRVLKWGITTFPWWRCSYDLHVPEGSVQSGIILDNE